MSNLFSLLENCNKLLFNLTIYFSHKDEEWVCRIYARNILTEKDLTVGGVEFRLKIVS